MDVLGCGDGGMEMVMVDVLMLKLKVVGLGLLYWSLRVRVRIQERMRSCELKNERMLALFSANSTTFICLHSLRKWIF